MPAPSYPFEPRSTAYLRPGQFWGIPLSDGRWACGRVLALPSSAGDRGPGDTRRFLAALMDWVGDDAPTADALAGCGLVDQGWAHVRTIQRTGRLVLGERDLALDAVRGLRTVTHRKGGTVLLMEGGTVVRPATPQEAATMPLESSWGYGVIGALAERRFAGR